MMNTPRPGAHVDRLFLFVTGLLVLAGFFVFSSASLGLMAREGTRFSTLALSQLGFGIGGGVVSLLVLAHIPYRSYRRFAPHFFVAALVLTALVFVPGIGIEANGARRWLDIFSWSVQPAEFLKIASVLALAWFYSSQYRRIEDYRYALGGIVGMLLATGALLLAQPDTGTFAIITIAAGAMALAAGIRVRHLSALGAFVLAGLIVLAMLRPYLLERVTTFLHPGDDPRGAGYQIKQSLIAVGSGGWVGRGFGQSVQKFGYLPEPTSDSIFSVAAEEFGFAGSTFIVGLIVFFLVRGLHIAARAPDRFGGLTVVGLTVLIVSQSFMNIGSMIGLMPLTGEPLVFMSRGGTSLLMALASVGIILSVSRHTQTRYHTTQH